MQAIPQSVGELLDQIEVGVGESVRLNPPYGFIHLDDFSHASDLNSLRMSALDYARVQSFCGQTSRPSLSEDRQLDYDQPFTVEELQQRMGGTNIGGLGGYLLHKSVQRQILVANDTDDIGDVKYRTKGNLKVPDAGLASGMQVMGMLAQRGIEAMKMHLQVKQEDMVQALITSEDALPIAFASMANKDNRKVEILYGLKNGGAYNEESARYELYQNDEDQFGFEFTAGGIIATNFEKVRKVLDSTGKCAAVNHPVFSSVWQQISKNTVMLLASTKRDT